MLSKSFTVACVLSLATSALLFSTPTQASPSFESLTRDADRFVDQAVRQVDFTWDNVDEKVHEVLDDLSHKIENKVNKATEWVKTLTHESFPGVQMRLMEPKLCDKTVKQVQSSYLIIFINYYPFESSLFVHGKISGVV